MDATSLPAVLFLLMAALVQQKTAVGELPPDFVGEVQNVTAIQGREAIFTCAVRNLKGFRVAWIRADNKAIQAIHDHVITHNPRVSVSRSDNKVWKLHIKSVQESDQGPYMCQINTDPMRSQVAYLDIHVPPDIISDESSGDVTLQEGGSTELKCRAAGVPEPTIKWRRDGDLPISIRHANGVSNKAAVMEFVGNVLPLRKVTREDMGSYFCIASNGVRPAVSKRINVAVQFPPTVTTPHQLVGANLGASVTLECNIQAFPKPLTYWRRTKGNIVLPVSSTGKHETVEEVNMKSAYSEIKLSLTIKNLGPGDYGIYYCVAKNTFGDAETSIRLHDTRATSGSSSSYSQRKSPHNNKSAKNKQPLDGNAVEEEEEIFVVYSKPKQVYLPDNNLQQQPGSYRNYSRSTKDQLFMASSASATHLFSRGGYFQNILVWRIFPLLITVLMRFSRF